MTKQRLSHLVLWALVIAAVWIAWLLKLLPSP